MLKIAALIYYLLVLIMWRTVWKNMLESEFRFCVRVQNLFLARTTPYSFQCSCSHVLLHLAVKLAMLLDASSKTRGNVWPKQASIVLASDAQDL